MASTKVPLLNPWLNSHLSTLDSTKVFLVGVAIFKKSGAGGTPIKHELLIVKRAENEEAFPDNWELPGGHVEMSDRDVRHTVDRETQEETGLIVEEVLGEFEELYWESKKSGKQNVQLNYAVTVKEGMPIKLNPDEHSDWLWATEDQIETLLMTPAMLKVLKDSFAFAKKHIAV